jgi:hypothetical protein
MSVMVANDCRFSIHIDLKTQTSLRNQAVALSRRSRKSLSVLDLIGLRAKRLVTRRSCPFEGHLKRQVL